MSFTTDTSTALGKVRVLITDGDVAHPIFTDDQLQVFIDLEGEDIFLASALAIETIATSEALILKVIETLDVKTDGAKLAEALMKRAKSMRDRVNTESGSFAIAAMIDTPSAWRERIRKNAMRGAI
jgi:hypothetical protein